MQSIRNSILSHVNLNLNLNLRRLAERQFFARDDNFNLLLHLRCCCSSTAASSDLILDRVIRLVNKYHKIDTSKVTEKADFQKDLSLDSLDRVEQEFSIEIPDEKADKLTCCADVAKYIASHADHKKLEKP